ncbi:MAG: phosphatase PAP2 family protein [Sulfuritalea sp.]|nr:phosphatase PAP2 family protein [Sulfuritalea sp.]
MGRRAIQAGLWWIAALGTLLATNAWVMASESGIPSFDRAGLILADAWRSPWLGAAFSGLTWLGSLILLLPAVLAAAFVLWSNGHRGDARFVMGALAGASILAHLTKQLALRPRPDLFSALTPVVSPLSFPSVHAVQVTAVAAALLLVVARRAPRRQRWAALLLVSAVVLVGLSRLYLQVHYPSDVLAGTIAAACWVIGLRLVMLAPDSSPQV